MKNIILLLLFAISFGQKANAAIINFGSNGCTLQDAIRSANADAPRGNCSGGSGHDTLISPDIWMITLSSQSLLSVIDSDMTIKTQTANGLLQISGNNNYRIMKITGSTTNVTLKNIEFSDGHSSVFSNGGGALRIIDASVTIEKSNFIRNITGAVNGSAIYIRDGTLDIVDSKIASNFSFSSASALYGNNSTVSILRSTFDNNNVYNANPSVGHGVFVENSQLTITESTFSNNGTTPFVQNLSFNSFLGAQIRAIQSDIELTNSTIYFHDSYNADSNRIAIDFKNMALNISNNSNININHATIYNGMSVFTDSSVSATNTVFWDCRNYNSNWTLASSNLSISDDLNQCENVLLNTFDSFYPILDFYGGPTKTVKLEQGGNSANTLGNPSYCLNTDQRGELRDSNCDIGAYERTGQTNVTMSYEAVTQEPYIWGQEIVFNAILKNVGIDFADNVSFDMNLTRASINSIDSPLCSTLPCIIDSIQPNQEVIIPIHFDLFNFQSNFSLEFISSPSAISGYNDLSSPHITVFDYTQMVEGADMGVEMNLVTPPSYFNGQTIEYTAIINNYGNNFNNNTNIKFDFIPSNLSISSFSNCDSVSGQTCTINFMGAGGSRTVTVLATITGSPFDVVATVSGSLLDIDLTNNIDEQGNNGAFSESDIRVSVDLIQSTPIYSSQYLQYDITIKTTSQPASGIKLWSSIPGADLINLQYCTMFSYCEIPDMTANSVTHVTAEYFAPVNNVIGSFFSHHVLVTPGQTDPDMSNNETTLTTTIVPQVDMNVKLDLVTQPPYYTGQNVEYRITAQNGGIDDANNVSISMFPTNLTFVSILSENCVVENCNLNSMGRFLQENISIFYQINSVGVFDLTTQITSDELDINLSNNIDDINNSGLATQVYTELMFQNGFE